MVGSTTEWEIIEASSLWGRLGATPTRTVVIRRRKYKVRKPLKIYYGAGVLSSPTVIKANKRDGSEGGGEVEHPPLRVSVPRSARTRSYRSIRSAEQSA